MGNFSRTVVVDNTGAISGAIIPLITIDPNDIDSFIMTGDQDFYWGFGDIGQAVIPVLANGSVSITNQDFKSPLLLKILDTIQVFLKLKQPNVGMYVSPINIYVKRQAAGNVNIAFAYLGGNLR